VGDSYAFLLGQTLRLSDEEQGVTPAFSAPEQHHSPFEIPTGRIPRYQDAPLQPPAADELQLTLKEKEQTISRLREETNRLITDLDKAIARQRELETAMEAKESELREQIAYYKNRYVSDGSENKALKEENARLKAEIEMLKAQRMLLPQPEEPLNWRRQKPIIDPHTKYPIDGENNAAALSSYRHEFSGARRQEEDRPL